MALDHADDAAAAALREAGEAASNAAAEGLSRRRTGLATWRLRKTACRMLHVSMAAEAGSFPNATSCERRSPSCAKTAEKGTAMEPEG